MTKLTIHHNAWVFIGDGQKALFLRNAGDEHFPNLTAERVFVDENPRTHEQGTDRPGRGFKRAMTNRRTSMETTDWHELEKHRFAQRVASAIEELVRARKVRAMIVAAPARTLAELRQALCPDVQRRVIAEIAKTLRNIRFPRLSGISSADKPSWRQLTVTQPPVLTKFHRMAVDRRQRRDGALGSSTKAFCNFQKGTAHG